MLINLNDGQIQRLIRGMNSGHFMGGAVAELHLNAPRMADDMHVRGDQTIRANDESRPKSFLRAASSYLGDSDDGGSRGFSDFGHWLGIGRLSWGLGQSRAAKREPQHGKKERAHGK